ncbi:tryptophan-rich sensory protein [Paraburkholderia sp. BL27I4N3]|nr:tryptophan-rich sensory protein [Paraburkholderia sp. BL27I4N3]
MQLLFNAAWRWLFSGLHRPDVALADFLMVPI